MITHEQMVAIDRFADDLRSQFTIKRDAIEFNDKIKNIASQYAWDIIALIHEKFKEEFEDWSLDMAVKHG